MFDSNKGDPPSVQMIPTAGPGYHVVNVDTLIRPQPAINGKTSRRTKLDLIIKVLIFK